MKKQQVTNFKIYAQLIQPTKQVNLEKVLNWISGGILGSPSLTA